MRCAYKRIQMMKEAMDNDNFSVREDAMWPDDEAEMARICGLR